MAVEILATETVDQALRQLSESMRKTVLSKIRLLADNPAHPSLQVHKLQKIKADIWDCYITANMRLLFEVKDGVLRLWNLGSHSIVDHAHLRGFAAHTRFSRMEMPKSPSTPSAELPSPAQPARQAALFPDKQPEMPVQVPQGTPNGFAYFQTAHLRVLGVPAHLIQPLKNAPSLEKALSLPGLPERTRLWLEELSTSPELEEVMFDSSRLLFRTTLDRFEGYCEGKIKRLMLNLQRPEQQQFVDMERTPLILLKGAAGSGKTTVGVYRAIRLAEQGRRVLVLTYNRTLSSVTKSLIEELIGPLPDNLSVMTLHQWMAGFLRRRSVRLNVSDESSHQLDEALTEVRRRMSAPVLQREKEFFAEEIRRVIKGLGVQSVEEYKEVERYGRKTALSQKQREVVWKVYETYQRRLAQRAIHDWSDVALLTMRALQEAPLELPYDDIIVDEAQDLLPIDLRIIQQLVAPLSGGLPARSSIMILADAAQTLYSRGFSWKQAGVQARGRTAILRKNFRNTRQIAEAAAYLLEQNTLMRSSNEYVDPEWTQRQGAFPIVIKATSPYNQLEVLRDRILDLVADQTFRLSDFAVLCPTNALCEQCKRELERAGLRTVYHKDSDFDLLEERVKILTIHSAKGLEFPVVFLLGLTSGTLPSTQGLRHAEPEEAQLFIEQQRTVCYVGMTRAAEALYLLTVKGSESRFIGELGDKVVQW